jgi:aryl carrier-like protein
MAREVFARFGCADIDANYFEAGLSSRVLAEVLTELRGLGLELALVDLYRFPTARALLEELARRAAPDHTGPSRTELPWAASPRRGH